MNQDNFFKELGRSYIVSAFFPSAFFVSVGILLFRGFLPKSIANQFHFTVLKEWGGQWILSIVLMLWVAFLLYSANDVTVKFFEGYFVPQFLSRFLKWVFQSRSFSKATKEYDEFLKINRKLERKKEKGKFPSPKLLKNHFDQYRKARIELQQHEMRWPYEYENLLPTRLGNVLRASEIYANDRYFIEEIIIWPRLFPLIPDEFTKAIEEQHNHLMFLLNSAVLAYINAIISLAFAIIGSFIHNTALSPFIQSKAGFFSIGYDYISPLGFLVISFALFFFGYRLYGIGVNVAEGLGLYVRSAFDLYRKDLLRQLNWKLPKTLDEEKELWEKISLYYSTGSRLKKPDFPNYCYYDKDGLEINNSPIDYGEPRRFES